MAEIIILNLIVSFMLTGLIWTIQLVHYPTFRFISEEKFSDFMAFHMKSITYVVGPLMIIELMATTYLVLYRFNILSLINIISVFLIWLSTIVLSVPCHDKLTKAYHEKTIHKLVLTNWPRTILWSFKAGISTLILNQ